MVIALGDTELSFCATEKDKEPGFLRVQLPENTGGSETEEDPTQGPGDSSFSQWRTRAVSSEIQDPPGGTGTIPPKGLGPCRVQALLPPCPGVQSPQVSLVQSEGLYSHTGLFRSWWVAWWSPLVRLTLSASGALLAPAHTEESNEHAQEQGQLQEDQEQEVDSAERKPVGDTTMGNEMPLRGRPRHPLVPASPCA